MQLCSSTVKKKKKRKKEKKEIPMHITQPGGCGEVLSLSSQLGLNCCVI
jgi:hypothetical protein